MKSFSLFVFFVAIAYERIFIKPGNTDIRFVTGSTNTLFASVCVEFSARKYNRLGH